MFISAGAASRRSSFCDGCVFVIGFVLAVEGFSLPVASSFSITLPLETFQVSFSHRHRNAPNSILRVYAKNPGSSKTSGVPFIDETSPSSSPTVIPSTVIGPLALLLLSQFILFIGVGAVIPTIPLYGKEIGLSSAANGIVISTPAVALVLGANWSGRQADLARKPAMLGGMAIIAVSDIGTSLAQSLPALVVARLGLGAGRAIAESGERGMLVDLANQIPSLRGRALAAQQAVIALGIAIGAPAGGIVVERYGPRAAFLCVSAAAVVALALYCFLPETVVQKKDAVESTAGKDNFKDKATVDTATDGVWKELLKQGTWRGLALCQSGASVGFAAKIASVPILAASTLPGGAAGAGALLSAAGLSGLIGAPIGGWSTDKIGAKWTAVISGIVSGMGLILVPVSLNTSFFPSAHIHIGSISLQGEGLFFSSAVIFWSLGATAQGPALTALAQQNAPAGAEATSLAFVKASGDGTYIAAPFLLGLLADAVKNTVGVECALAGATTIMGVIALALLDQEPTKSTGTEPY